MYEILSLSREDYIKKFGKVCCGPVQVFTKKYEDLEKDLSEFSIIVIDDDDNDVHFHLIQDTQVPIHGPSQ